MKTPIRVLIVDDQVLFREALHTLLTVQSDFQVVAEASTGEEALRLALEHHPDVILMDLRMPVMDGATATRRLKNQLPGCRVIVLTTFDDDEYVFDGLRAGAVGYLLKDTSSDKLFEAINAAARGEYFLMPSITAKVLAEFARISGPTPSSDGNKGPILSDRELEVLRLVATGASNKEIADHLVIAEGTVKNHLTNILGKIGAQDRLQAVLRAREMGYLK
ncbi:MAG: response regulator transcription factor [Anaerolineaceae bacterium]|nr:response regulator transcription factor [Anaerolineaceae bacterium]